MDRLPARRRLLALENAVAAIQSRLDDLTASLEDILDSVAGRAPASEVERLSHAFDLIEERAPASEIARLNHAFEQISELTRQTRAIDDEVTQAHTTLDQLAPEVARISHEVLWESERTNQLLERAVELSPEVAQPNYLANALNSRFDALYHRFENLYRGSREDILERVQHYQLLLDLASLREIGPAVDLGAGRGEWVEFLKNRGFNAYGVDVNEELADAAAAIGVEVRIEDIVSHLRSLGPNTAGLISMFHVAEHLDFEVLTSVIRAASLALNHGGVLLIETPNPTNLRVGAAGFYLDPTHVKPLHPTLLHFLYTESGLTRVSTHFLNQGDQEPSLEVPMALREDPAGLRLVDFLNQNLLSPLDYVVIGYKS